LLDAVVADIGRPSAKSAVLHSPLLRRFCADLNGARGTADGKPVHIFLSDVSVKLTGSDTWMKAE
jgi:hypothetical protein